MSCGVCGGDHEDREKVELRAEIERLKQDMVTLTANLHARELEGYRQREAEIERLKAQLEEANLDRAALTKEAAKWHSIAGALNVQLRAADSVVSSWTEVQCRHFATIIDARLDELGCTVDSTFRHGKDEGRLEAESQLCRSRRRPAEGGEVSQCRSCLRYVPVEDQIVRAVKVGASIASVMVCRECYEGPAAQPKEE